MRKIDGPGAVSNEFVDYDAVTNPNGTVYTADYGNDVQDELVGIQDEFSIAEAAGTNKYVLASIKGIAIKLGKQLGEMFYLDSVKTPVAFDKDSPETFFPGLCLDTIDTSTDISSTNWPDLVTHLRARALTYNEGISGQKSTFDVTDWAIVSNVATLTFANTTAENAILDALSEDNLVHGSYSNWRSITLGSAIGSIDAGEYALTDVDPLTRTVKFAFTAADGGASGTFTANFYTNRVSGSTTTARVYEATGRTLVSANDGEAINGLRRRDRFQGHYHRALTDSSFAAGGTAAAKASGLGSSASVVTAPITDGANDDPRTGKTTDPRSAVGHIYLWGQSYTA
jgi:hypothetical protein